MTSVKPYITLVQFGFVTEPFVDVISGIFGKIELLALQKVFSWRIFCFYKMVVKILPDFASSVMFDWYITPISLLLYFSIHPSPYIELFANCSYCPNRLFLRFLSTDLFFFFPCFSANSFLFNNFNFFEIIIFYCGAIYVLSLQRLLQSRSNGDLGILKLFYYH